MGRGGQRITYRPQRETKNWGAIRAWCGVRRAFEGDSEDGGDTWEIGLHCMRKLKDANPGMPVEEQAESWAALEWLPVCEGHEHRVGKPSVWPCS